MIPLNPLREKTGKNRFRIFPVFFPVCHFENREKGWENREISRENREKNTVTPTISEQTSNNPDSTTMLEIIHQENPVEQMWHFLHSFLPSSVMLAKGSNLCKRELKTIRALDHLSSWSGWSMDYPKTKFTGTRIVPDTFVPPSQERKPHVHP